MKERITNKRKQDRFAKALEAINREYAAKVNELAAVWFASKGAITK